MGNVTFKNMPPGKATVTKSIKNGKTGTTIETSGSATVTMEKTGGASLEAKYAQPFAQVSFSAGFTVGLPNYSSSRCDIGLQMPCDPTQIEETFAFVEKWVTDKLTAEHATLEGSK